VNIRVQNRGLPYCPDSSTYFQGCLKHDREKTRENIPPNSTGGWRLETILSTFDHEIGHENVKAKLQELPDDFYASVSFAPDKLYGLSKITATYTFCKRALTPEEEKPAEVWQFIPLQGKKYTSQASSASSTAETSEKPLKRSRSLSQFRKSFLSKSSSSLLDSIPEERRKQPGIRRTPSYSSGLSKTWSFRSQLFSSESFELIPEETQTQDEQEIQEGQKILRRKPSLLKRLKESFSQKSQFKTPLPAYPETKSITRFVKFNKLATDIAKALDFIQEHYE
jgi:hypothetical protein